MRGGKKLSIWKIWILSFILHQKLCKNVQNSRKSISLKIQKKSEKSTFFQKILQKIDFFKLLSNFKKFDFHEFLTFLLDFLCKMRLSIQSLLSLARFDCISFESIAFQEKGEKVSKTENPARILPKLLL